MMMVRYLLWFILSATLICCLTFAFNTLTSRQVEVDRNISTSIIKSEEKVRSYENRIKSVDNHNDLCDIYNKWLCEDSLPK